MKELLITLITLAGLFVGVHCYDRLMGQAPSNDQQSAEKEVVPQE